MITNNQLSGYIEDCRTKAEYHKIQARNANTWWNFLGILQVILTASNAFAITVLAIYTKDENAIAITSGLFAFSVAIFSRVQSAYAFNLLALQNHTSYDDYIELVRDFTLLELEYDNSAFNIFVHRHTSVIEKSHHQPINNCWLLQCCC